MMGEGGRERPAGDGKGRGFLDSVALRLWLAVRACLSYGLYLWMDRLDRRAEGRAVRPRGARRS